jgi:hypothetical protein
MAAGFRMYYQRGFQVEFENGITVALMFQKKDQRNDQMSETSDISVTVWDTDGRALFLSDLLLGKKRYVDEEDAISGTVTPDEIAYIMWAARRLT